MAKIRLNMNLDDEIVSKVDEEAKRMGLNRTSAISMMIAQYLNQQEALKAVNKMNDIAELLKEKGIIENA